MQHTEVVCCLAHVAPAQSVLWHITCISSGHSDQYIQNALI